MHKQIIITALTRMAKPRVCIAGYDAQAQVYIRPVIPYLGVTEAYLLQRGQLAIKPFVVVELDLVRPVGTSPHTEDWEINLQEPYHVIGSLSEEERHALLQHIAQPQVDDLFGTEVVAKRIPVGQGSRSLGTIKPRIITRVLYREEPDGKYKLRLSFVDQGGSHYEFVPVTDIAAYHYCHYQRVGQRVSTNRICSRLIQTLNQHDSYLHLGLTRPYSLSGKSPCCFLQVIGIFSVPDFLAGKDYTDFSLGEQDASVLEDDVLF